MSQWQTVCVFISSTFRDMHAERDYLIRRVFPEIRRRCEAYRLYLEDIDLRWGVTREQAENNLVVELCLRQVKASRPFFIGLLGDRYGWRPTKIPEDTVNGFAWIKDYLGRSVTELEIIFGYEMVDPKPHALFFERDPAAYTDVPAETANIYRDADDADRTPLAALKNRLREQGAIVDVYTCRWDPSVRDISNGQQGRFVDLDEFGRVVLERLWQAIKAAKDIPNVPPAYGNASPFEIELAEQDYFRETRQRIFHGRHRELNELNSFIEGNDRRVCVVNGPAGLGKSSLLARFITDEELNVDSASKFIYHFVGASGASTDLRLSLNRWVYDIATWLGVLVPSAESVPDLLPVFRGLLASVPKDRRLILVIDAIDQFGNESQVHDLIWLPEEPYPNVRLVVSCPNDLPPAKANIWRELTTRDIVRVELSPLTESVQRQIIGDVISLAAKSLDDGQISILLAHPGSANPLYLRAALEELRGFSPFERLNDFLRELPAGDAMAAVRELFDRIVERLEREFGGRELVERVLGSLVCSVRGLSEDELARLVADLPGRDDLQPLLRHLRCYLIRRGELYAFYHRALSEACLSRYFNMHPGDKDTEEKESAHRQLARYFEKGPLSDRVIEEYPWHLLAAKEYDTLAAKLIDGPFFKAAWDKDEFALRRWWSVIQSATNDRITIEKAYQQVVENPAQSFPLWPLGILLQTTGCLDLAEDLWSRLGDQARALADKFGLLRSLVNQAVILHARGRLEEAMSLLKEQEQVARELADKVGLLASLGNQSLILQDWGQLEDAMRLRKEQELLCEKLADKAGLATSLGGQAVILSYWGRLEEAMRLHKEVERLCKELADKAQLSRTLACQAGILKDWGRLEDAMSLLKEQKRLCKELADKAGLSTNFGNQAGILQAWGRLEEAMDLHKEEERLCKELANKAGLSRNLGNQAGILRAWGRLEDAMRLLKEQERICRELSDKVGLYHSLGHQAVILHAWGRPEEAMDLHKEEERLCKELANKAGLQRSLGHQALILQDWGRLVEAMSLFKEQEQLCNELADKSGQSASLGNQAEILRAWGRLEEAMSLHKEEGRLCTELADKAGESASLGNQALIIQAWGRLEDAMRLLKKQELLCRELADTSGQSASLGNQAGILRAWGRLEDAMSLLKEQERICRELSDNAGLSRTLGSQALILRDWGRLEEAMELHKQEERLKRELADKLGLALCLGHQALILSDWGRLEQAMRLHKEEERIFTEVADKAGLYKSLGNQAVVLKKWGRLEEAMRLHKEEEQLCKELDDKRGLSRSIANQAVILQDSGRLNESMKLHQEAEQLFRQLADPDGLALSFVNQGILYLKQGQTTEGFQKIRVAYQLAVDHSLIALADRMRGAFGSILNS